MPKRHVTILGKTVRKIAMARGGGSAFPGLFVEKIDPEFVARCLAQLPYGVAIVSGTNGKTTTTKMVVELLESQGLKVFTNRTGSNFVRGVAAALLGAVDNKGVLDADIAVLELDEAHAVHFVQRIAPRYSLLLNVMRDQLDRFGEIDKTAELLHRVAETTTHAVIVNRDDPRLGNGSFVENLSADIRSYGASSNLLKQFPSDDDMRRRHSKRMSKGGELYNHDTSLESLDGQTAVMSWQGRNFSIELQLTGIYNILNATAAVALTRAIIGDRLDVQSMLEALATVTPAFGRGETIIVNGSPVELILVKNPAGFRLSLQSFPPDDHATMIAINDNYADGRDMSWLWDVDFDSLAKTGVAQVSGVRAYDMALRLQYEDVEIAAITPDIADGLHNFLRETSGKPKHIFCTYTAMLAIRKQLAKQTQVKEVRA